METKFPQHSDEVELGHHIVYYTFLPFVVLDFGLSLVPVALWLLGTLPWFTAFGLQWLSIILLCIYLHTLGDYVVPRQVYREAKEGVYDEY